MGLDIAFGLIMEKVFWGVITLLFLGLVFWLASR